MPSPTQQKQVLTQAVIQLVESCPETTQWLLQNADSLEPDIHVATIIAQTLTEKLVAWGVSKENFHFTDNGNLRVNEPYKTQLFNHLRFQTEPIAVLVKSLLSY